MTWVAISSPIGELGVSVDDAAVRGVSFGRPSSDLPAPHGGRHVLAQVRDELAQYFDGERTEFEVPYVLRGGSEFEHAVWRVIATIAYGATMSYGAIAKAVGEPGGAQAVGAACNHNPVPIIVPCHRVIGSNGKLVGFGGGLHRKRFLLQLEARIHIEQTFAPPR